MNVWRFRNILNHPSQDKATTRTGFQFLAEELIQEILRYLHWPTDFYNLSLVSRTLNRLATHDLYSILVVGYHRPDRTSALLAHLEVRPDLSSLITTLVFDEDVKSIGPKLPEPGKWPSRVNRRELADGWDPKSPDILSANGYPYNRFHETISRQLNMVLPRLPNIQRVIMRSLHPLYRHPDIQQKKSDAATNGTRFTALYPTSDDTVWTCLSRRLSSITELVVNGVTRQMPPDTMVSSLTAICILDLYYILNSHEKQASAWNVILEHAVNLQTLGMIRVEYAHRILAGRSFPHLEALELYKVCLGEPDQTDTQGLSQFLRRHSSTLRTLALSTHIYLSVNYCDWLSDESILPNLQTLRLDDFVALLGIMTDTYLPGDNPVRDTHVENTKLITSFIEHRPTILDVGISSLATSEADKFAEYLAQTRPMRKVFIGSTVIQSLKNYTSISLWDYSYEAWTFYQLFEGLTISRSGFRPTLPLKTWKFWKKPSP